MATKIIKWRDSRGNEFDTEKEAVWSDAKRHAAGRIVFILERDDDIIDRVEITRFIMNNRDAILEIFNDMENYPNI